MKKRFEIMAATLALIGIGAAGWLYGNLHTPFAVPGSKPPPPGPNAFDDFARAASLERDKAALDATFGPPGESSRPIPIDYSSPRPPYGITPQKQRQLASENAPAIAALRTGFDHAYFAPPIRSMMQETPYLAPDRGLARVCSFAASDAARQGNWAGSERLSLDAIQLGAEVSQNGAMIHKLVGDACHAIGRRDAWPAVSHLDARTAATDARRMEQITQLDESPADALRSEERVGKLTLNTLLGSGPNNATRLLIGESADGSGRVSAFQILQSEITLDIGYLIYPKRKIEESYSGYFDNEIRKFALPYHVAASIPAAPLPRDPLNLMLLPQFAQFRFTVTRDQTYDALLTIALALQAYRLDHGGVYPAALTDLTPKYLTSVPPDPFAPGSAQFHYKPADNGQSYLLYSVGPDGIDNGGTPISYKNRNPASSSGGSSQPTDTGDIVAGKNYT